MRNTIAIGMAAILQFILLGWVASSWGLFWPVFIPENNVVLVTAFHQIFFGLILSGSLAPVLYDDIYNEKGVGIISGLFSPSRFFLESLMVNEYRATPVQHGHTINFEETMETTFYDNFAARTRFLNGFSYRELAMNDSSVTTQTNMGWYWGVLPSIFVGLSVRFLALVLVRQKVFFIVHSFPGICLFCIAVASLHRPIASLMSSLETAEKAYITRCSK